MYFKYNWSCICILHFCKSEILFQNTFQVKSCSMLRKKCYQTEFIFAVLIGLSATLGTYGYLVTENKTTSAGDSATTQRPAVLCC